MGEALSTEPCEPCLALSPRDARREREKDPRYAAVLMTTFGGVQGAPPRRYPTCKSHGVMLLGNKVVTDVLRGIPYQPGLPQEETEGESK